MKAVILAGGLGTRLSEETQLKPKPMVEIGGKPILWHIMKIFSSHGVNDFVVCCGYKGYVIKEYFANYFLHVSDVTFDMEKNQMEVHQSASENWRVTLIDTGESTGTGGRLKKVREFLDDEDFYFTYGDGVADVNITELTAFHKEAGTLGTMTTIQPPNRFGVLEFNGNKISAFKEKPTDGGWINGGFFVLSPRVIDYIERDDIMWEAAPLEKLVDMNELSAYKHDGFWQAMDTLRDNKLLNTLWDEQQAPWKTW